MSDFCRLFPVNFVVFIWLIWPTSVHLGYVPSLLGQISHNTKIVASFHIFLNMLKSSYLVLFSWRKTQKTKKNAVLFKIFYLISPQQGHSRTWFKLILEATVQSYNFCFLTILGNWSCDHPPNNAMDPERYHHPYPVFSP